VVVFGVSAARAVGVPVNVGAGVDFDVDEGVDFDVDEGGKEEEEEAGLVVVFRESTVGIEDSGDEDRDGEYITDGKMVAFVMTATADGVDIVCIVVDWSRAFICVLALYAAVGQKHWHLQPSFPAPPALPPAVADGRTVVRAVAVFVPVAAGAAVEEETVPLILIAVSLNI